MKLLSRRDVVSSIVTGLTTGVIAWRVLAFLGSGLPLGIDPVVLVLVVPVLWLAGVQLGYALAVVFRPMAQFGKFAAIGFANALVDFGVLYLFIGLTGRADGLHYAVFKAVSFGIATVHSYFWNKYWAFDAGRTAVSGREVFSFLGVSLASLAVNVGAASLTVAVGPLAGLSVQAWAGIGAIVGSAVSLILNFAGLRVFVFRKK